MSNQKFKHAFKTKAEKNIEEIIAEVNNVLSWLSQIEVKETWMEKLPLELKNIEDAED